MKKLLLILSMALLPLASQAEIKKGDHRFGLSGQVVHINNPSQTGFSLGLEYEYRLEPLYGLGLQANYFFADVSIGMVSAPAFFLHPLLGDWYISAAPVFYFGSNFNTLVGARFTTRMPLNIDILTLIPTFGVDIIQGGPNYLFGLGISI